MKSKSGYFRPATVADIDIESSNDKDFYILEPAIIPSKDNEAIFEVQGSAPEPYTVRVTLNPLAISCTCQAGQNGTPCKHRIQILKGYKTYAVGVPQNCDEVLRTIKKTTDGSGIFEFLEEYESVKNQIKISNEKTDKLFRKYRTELTNFVLKKEKTDKKSMKAKIELDEAVESGITIESKKENLLDKIRTVFILPY